MRRATGILLTALFAAAFTALRQSEATMWVYSFLLLPGTAAHELAHWLAAWWLGADPQGFTLWPVRDDDGLWTLGSVQARIGAVSTATVSLAPIALAPLAIRLTALAARGGPPRRLGLAYLAACAWTSFWPSSVDWVLATAMPSSWLLAGVMALIVLALCYAAVPGREST